MDRHRVLLEWGAATALYLALFVTTHLIDVKTKEALSEITTAPPESTMVAIGGLKAAAAADGGRSFVARTPDTIPLSNAGGQLALHGKNTMRKQGAIYAGSVGESSGKCSTVDSERAAMRISHAERCDSECSMALSECSTERHTLRSAVLLHSSREEQCDRAARTAT